MNLLSKLEIRNVNLEIKEFFEYFLAIINFTVIYKEINIRYEVMFNSQKEYFKYNITHQEVVRCPICQEEITGVNLKTRTNVCYELEKYYEILIPMLLKHEEVRYQWLQHKYKFNVF